MEQETAWEKQWMPQHLSSLGNEPWDAVWDRLTDGLKTLLHADAEQRRETADALARQVPIPRWQGLAVEKRTGIAYNGERKRAPCGGRGGPRGGVRGEMDACCKNRSNG